MPARSDQLITVALVLAALAVGAASIHREFIAPWPGTRGSAVDPGIRFDGRWLDYERHGVLIGRPDAPVRILEFTDFECPFCRRLHHDLVSLHERFGDSVAVVVVHFPLSQHRLATPAARASECAAAQGSFPAFVDAVFAKQDSLGLKPLTEYAADAGVPDLMLFDRCNKSVDPFPRIDSGLATGRLAGVRGTPTVLISGWRLPGTPDRALLESTVTDLLAGRTPDMR